MSNRAESFLVGLVGDGVMPSLTPHMHEREGDVQGLRYLYRPIDLLELGLPGESVAGLLQSAYRLGFNGLNITHPCKQLVLDFLDEVSPDARRLGAVNTVIIRDGRFIGHNTDFSGFAAALALLAVTIDETDEAFANVYSTAVSLQNVVPQVEQRVLIAGVAAVATFGALVVQLRNYESFLLLLGSCFVPLFGVLLADWLASGARYTAAQIFGAPAWRTDLLVAWLLGFLLYHWLHEPPLGPSWWADIVEETGQPNLGIGASLPSFAASFVLALGLGSLGSRLPEPASKW